MIKTKSEKRIRRHTKIRAKVKGTTERPRLAISKSNRNIVAQIIDDAKGETLCYVWTKDLAGKTMSEKSVEAGKKIAELAQAKKITKVVFDRGGYIYTGNIKALADSARKAGLEF